MVYQALPNSGWIKHNVTLKTKCTSEQSQNPPATTKRFLLETVSVPQRIFRCSGTRDQSHRHRPLFSVYHVVGLLPTVRNDILAPRMLFSTNEIQ
jgi:hypothetical protein